MNMASGARPIYWKKLPATIWNPTTGNIINTMHRPSDTTSIMALSAPPFEPSTNAAATVPGMKWPMRNAAVVTPMAASMVYLSVFITRSYCRAP